MGCNICLTNLHDAVSIAVNSLQDMALNIGMTFDSAWLCHSELVALRIGFSGSQTPE